MLLDFGLAPVVATEMTIATEKGNISRTQELLNRLAGTTLLLAAIVIAVGITVAAMLFHFETLDRDSATALSALSFCTALSIFGGLLDAPLRASGLYVKGVYLLNFTRLIEWLFGMVGAYTIGTMTGVASFMLFGRLAATVLFAYQTKIAISQRLNIQPKIPNQEFVSTLLFPALAYMSFPITNAIILQGTSIAVGTAFGAAHLAVFNTYRTYTRLFVQLTAVLTKSIWPSITTGYAKGEYSAVRMLCNKTRYATLYLAAGYAVFNYVAGSSIVQFWSHGQIGIDETALLLLSAAAIIGSFWQIDTVALMATNRQNLIAIPNLIAAIASIIATVLATKYGTMTHVLVVLCAYEFVMLVLSSRKFRSTFEELPK